LKSPNRFFISFSLFLILIASITASVPVVRCPPTVHLSLYRTVYGTGEDVALGVRVDGGGGPLRLVFGTPMGTVNLDYGAIASGVFYTVTASGVTAMPGAYTVKAIVWVGGVAYSSATLAFAVGGGSGFGFDFSLDLSPSSQTVEQGGTATFRILATYSSSWYYGTSISIEVAGLGAGMDSRYTASGDLYISTSLSTPPGTYTIAVIGSARGVFHKASAVLIVTAKAPPFDYSVSVSPSTQTVSIGDKVSFSIVVNLVSGSPAATFLTLSGLPSGLAYSFSPQSGTPTFTSTLTIDASAATSTGSYTFTITAAGGGLSKTVTAGIVVKEAPDFTLTVSPDTATVKQGEKASFNIKVDPTGGFDKLVSLNVAGLPTGVSATFTVPSGKPPLVSTLTITVSASAPEGSYSLSIEAVGDVKIHSTRITLNVERMSSLIEQIFGPQIAPLVIPAGLVMAIAFVAGIVILLVVRGRRPPATPRS